MNKRGVAVVLTAACVLLSGCQATALENGTQQLQQKNYQEAALTFQKAQNKSTMKAEAYKGEGIAQFELKEYKKAEKALKQALKEGVTKTASLYNMLGISQMEQEKYEDAQQSFETGLKVDGISEALKQEMSKNEIVALEKQNRFAEAKEKLNAYAAAYPEDAEAQKEAAFLETQAGE